MPANYLIWSDGVTPHTSSEARPSRTRMVAGVKAIRVRGATYRNSQPIDGVFELVSVTPQMVKEEQRYEVYCAWFGVKPKTKYPRILVSPRNCEFISNFTGEVIDNISG